MQTSELVELTEIGGFYEKQQKLDFTPFLERINLCCR